MSKEIVEIDAVDAHNTVFDYTEFIEGGEKQFERFHTTELAYNEFFVDFMRVNKPVIISGIADRWECMNWTHQNSINFAYLRERIDPTSMVPVANCNKIYFNSHEKSEMRFGEFLDYWQQRIDGTTNDDSLYYLKDWHLQRCMPNYEFYKTPLYFTSDWLNEFCLKSDSDDYRFVYMGPKGTWTPFHSDVFSSFSWSTNIVGVKRWFFYPPGEELKLHDAFGNLPFKVDEATIEQSRAACIEIIQNAGETVFVPSGWHHQVMNLEDTISVNHNWFNGCNVRAIQSELRRTYDNVLKEIDDCRDMEDFENHCQLMLRSVFGLDFKSFLEILTCIAENRMNMLNGDDVDESLNGPKLGKSHILFDLRAIYSALNDLKGTAYGIKQIESIEGLINRLQYVIKWDKNA